MAWKPTPMAERFKIKRYDRVAQEWADCEFRDLRLGDVYVAFAPDGTLIDPLTGEPDGGSQIAARAEMDARKSETNGYGYEVAVITGPIDEMLRAGLT